MKALLFSLTTCVFLLSTGCKESHDEVETNVVQFNPRITSKHSLMGDFFAALQMSDSAKLRSLAITKDEFENHLWPEFPMSDPAMNVPEGFAWGNLSRISEKGLRRLIRECGGRYLRLKQLLFTEPEERYKTFVVHQSSEIHVMNDEGKEFILPLRASVVEMNGTYKFMSFRVK